LKRRSPLFCEHILEHSVIEGQIGDRCLEPAVLIFKLLEASRLVYIEATVLSFPAVISLLTNAMRATSVGDSLTCFDALQNVDDLLFGKSGLAHLEFSSSR
jgi:hypothetical protein